MSEKQMRLGALEAGGTKMVCAVVSGDGEVLDRMETPTLTPAETVPQMIEWFAARDMDALGIGAFGPTCVDPDDERYGSILQTPKLAWRGHGLRAAFADALGIPVAYDTDVNVACLGEVVFGCCKGLEDAVYVTIGTGVGGGIVVEGKLLHGAHGSGAEIGHLVLNRDETVPCNCGKRGCVEQYCSATGIVRMAKLALEASDEDSALRRLSNLTCKDIFDAGKQGDRLALQVLDKYYAYMGEFLADVCCVVNPEVVVLGGGVSKAGDVLLAMGNSDVPVGQYTQKILAYYDLDEEALAAAGVITYGSNVKEVTTQISEGSVDAGVVYCTDAYSAGLTPVDEATAEMCGQVIYPAAVLKAAPNAEAAREFLAYLQTDRAATVFEGVGFTAM